MCGLTSLVIFIIVIAEFWDFAWYRVGTLNSFFVKFKLRLQKFELNSNFVYVLDQKLHA